MVAEMQLEITQQLPFPIERFVEQVQVNFKSHPFSE